MAPKSSFLSYPCTLCINLVKWLPVLFIVVVIVWSYYAYVIQLNLLTIESYVEKAIYLLVYHILLVLFMWSYWQTVFTYIGTVPKQFQLPSIDLNSYLSAETEEVRRDTLENFCSKQNLPVANRTLTGEIRYCDKCTLIKPDRCHHCSVCGNCVLKMDHHCPWVNNCVAFTNYKYFILFLGYGLTYCLFIAATTLQYFIMFWTNQLSTGAGKLHILFLFFVSIMFAISLVSLFGYHLFLTSRNRSTLETFRGPIFKVNRETWVQDKEGFSLGSYNNFVEIFGENKSKWLLPLFTSIGDGVTFPLRSPLSSSLPSPPSASPPAMSYGSTNTSLGDGVSFPQRCIDEDTDGLLGSRQRWNENDDLNGRFMAMNGQELQEVVVESANHTNQV